MSSSIDKVVDRHVALQSRMQGCDQTEITLLETTYKLTLPIAYKEFLLKMGRSRGVEIYGQFSFMPELIENTGEAREELEDLPNPLPDDAFVFSARQAYSFFFFHCDGSVDPAVYRILDDGEPPLLASDSFSQYLYDYLPLLFDDIGTINS